MNDIITKSMDTIKFMGNFEYHKGPVHISYHDGALSIQEQTDIDHCIEIREHLPQILSVIEHRHRGLAYRLNAGLAAKEKEYEQLQEENKRLQEKLDIALLGLNAVANTKAAKSKSTNPNVKYGTVQCSVTGCKKPVRLGHTLCSKHAQ